MMVPRVTPSGLLAAGHPVGGAFSPVPAHVVGVLYLGPGGDILASARKESETDENVAPQRGGCDQQQRTVLYARHTAERVDTRSESLVGRDCRGCAAANRAVEPATECVY